MAPLKLLIVAAAGGLGRCLVLEALARGHTVSALVRSRAKLAEALGDTTLARLAAVHEVDGTSAEAVTAAAAGADVIVSAAVSDVAIARAVGAAAKNTASVSKVVWTAGASNILEPDGVTYHSARFGPRGEGFFKAHAPCIEAVRSAAGAKAMVWCPGMMRAAGHKSPSPVAISNRAIPGGLKTFDFVSYEDGADAILRAVEGSEFDGQHFTAITPEAGAASEL